MGVFSKENLKKTNIRKFAEEYLSEYVDSSFINKYSIEEENGVILINGKELTLTFKEEFEKPDFIKFNDITTFRIQFLKNVNKYICFSDFLPNKSSNVHILNGGYKNLYLDYLPNDVFGLYIASTGNLLNIEKILSHVTYLGHKSILFSDKDDKFASALVRELSINTKNIIF